MNTTMYSIQQYCDNDLEPRVSEKPSPDQPLESNVPEQFATTPRKRKRKSPTTLKRDKLRLQKWLATKPFWKSSLHDKQDHLLDTKFQPGLGIQLGEIQEHDQDQIHEQLATYGQRTSSSKTTECTTMPTVTVST